MNKNASKGNALAKLADHLGLNKDEVMVPLVTMKMTYP